MKQTIDKVVIAGGSNTGVWGRSSRAEPPMLKRLLQLFFQKYTFLSILWY